MLANIVSLKKNIVISGSHGKTTTTSLIAQILSSAKLDPTNAKFGKGDWTVLEADESDGSFLKFPINYSIVTNIDNEHTDYYKNFDNLKKAFLKFINKTPPIGKSFLCLDNSNIRKILKKIKTKNYFTYGFDKNSDYKISNTRYNINKTIFDIQFKNLTNKSNFIRNIKLNLIGAHNLPQSWSRSENY